MTVAELIAKLQQMPQDQNVIFFNGEDWTDVDSVETRIIWNDAGEDRSPYYDEQFGSRKPINVIRIR